ncbi:MAG TPA: alternate F1F0 ATPase, F1 subunit alpha [Acidimicrobiia bacterium]|nr:alternate F1F0 ATPase, F1 subunit alpha [Acidimicrobiia bacterium]
MTENRASAELLSAADRALESVRAALPAAEELPVLGEVGRVTFVGRGVVEVSGLPGVTSEELVRFQGGGLGMAFNLDPDRVGVVLLDTTHRIEANDDVRRTGRVLDVPVGRAVLGRVIDPAGRPLDGGRPLGTTQRWPVEGPAPAVIDRAPVDTPLHTGIKVIDALIPVGRGQRELILGDRQTGKTTVAVDTILAQRGTGVISVYCAIGQRGSAVAKVVALLRSHGALAHTVVVATTGNDPPGRQFVAAYAATSIAEWFMERGHDVLIVYDDLTKHARAYRELSLLLRRPPGREAYPGDIFYVHSRLLERATHLAPHRGGGSLTALPVVETQAQNLAAYIPTNLISITDGQVALSPRLFHQGVLPAVDVGRSVSRVGGRAQLPAFRAVAGNLRLAYSQFEELERFARYGARLEEGRRLALERGRRVREVLKQAEHSSLSPGEQIAVLLAVVEGVFDEVPVGAMADAQAAVRRQVQSDGVEILRSLTAGSDLDAKSRERLVSMAREAIAGHRGVGDADQ